MSACVEESGSACAFAMSQMSCGGDSRVLVCQRSARVAEERFTHIMDVYFRSRKIACDTRRDEVHVYSPYSMRVLMRQCNVWCQIAVHVWI